MQIFSNVMKDYKFWLEYHFAERNDKLVENQSMDSISITNQK